MNSNWMDLPDFSDKEEQKPFDTIPFAKRSWIDNKTVRYRVYSTPTEFVEVEAQNASIAINASGIEQPHKVERVIKDNMPILGSSELTDVEHSYTRPVLEMLTEESPVLSNQVITGLIEASKEIAQEKNDKETEENNKNPEAE